MTITENRDAARINRQFAGLAGLGGDYPKFETPTDPTGSAKVDKAVKAYTGLAARQKAAARDHRRLVDSRRQADAADTRAAADAIKAGQPDPGPTNATAHAADVATAKRQAMALGLATSEAASDLAAVVNAERARLVEHADGRLTAAVDAWADAVSALDAAGVELVRARRGARWAEKFPQVHKFSFAAPPRLGGIGDVAELVGRLRALDAGPDAA